MTTNDDVHKSDDAHRSEKVILLQQFRNRHPDWAIDSKVVKTDGAIVIQATILDLDGKVRSSGHGSVAFQSAGFDQDLAEQAEDSAIERALIHLFGGDNAPTAPSGSPTEPPTSPDGDDDRDDISPDLEEAEGNVPGTSSVEYSDNVPSTYDELIHVPADATGWYDGNLRLLRRDIPIVFGDDIAAAHAYLSGWVDKLSGGEATRVHELNTKQLLNLHKRLQREYADKFYDPCDDRDVPGSKEPAKPYLAGDPASKRRVRNGMTATSQRLFNNGSPVIKMFRRPTGT